MTDVAQKWNNITKNLIDNVEVELPNSDGVISKCLEDRKISKGPAILKSDVPFDIKIVSPLVSKRVPSLQYGSCGQRGRGISVSVNTTSELMLRNWINNRFGVFLENLNDLDIRNKSAAVSKLQHLLCQGRSVEEIIQELNGGYNILREYVPPNFTYFLRPKRRAYVLAVQRSFPEATNEGQKAMNWDVVQSALLPFVSALPTGHQIAIVTFDQKSAEINLPMTKLTDDNRVLLHAALPRRPVLNDRLSMEACHQCGINTIQSLATTEENDEVLVIWNRFVG